MRLRSIVIFSNIGIHSSMVAITLGNLVSKKIIAGSSFEKHLSLSKFLQQSVKRQLFVVEWISDGRVDCGFLRLLTRKDFEVIFLEQDDLLVILPESHPLADCERFPVTALCNDPFMLLEKDTKAEVSEIFEQYDLTPKVHFTTCERAIHDQVIALSVFYE